MTRKRSNPMKLSLAAAAIAAAGLLVTTDVANAEPHLELHTGGYGSYGDGSYYYDDDRYGTVHGGIDYDRNGDGVLSYRERLIEQFDRNHDGRLDATERRAFQDYQRIRDRRGYSQGYSYGYSDPYGSDRSPEHLDEHDLNKDGVIDHYEMQQLNRHDQLEDLFKIYDRNADGYLSFGESNRTPLRRHFRSADHDVDGYLGWNEIEHYLEAPEQHRPNPRHRAYRGGSSGRWFR